jgi:hypothetical protein
VHLPRRRTPPLQVPEATDSLPPKIFDRTGAEHRPNLLLSESEDTNTCLQLLVITVCQKMLDSPSDSVAESARFERTIHRLSPFAAIKSARILCHSISCSDSKTGPTLSIERNASFPIQTIFGSTLAVLKVSKSNQPQLWFRNTSTGTASCT